MLPNIRENFTKAQFKLEFACDEPKCCQIVACKSSTSELKKNGFGSNLLFQLILTDK